MRGTRSERVLWYWGFGDGEKEEEDLVCDATGDLPTYHD
jgi:hypothetical protein